MNSKRKIVFNFGELFCGPGGLSFGAITSSLVDTDGNKYQIKHKWANDHDRDSCRTYALNICNGKNNTVICEEVEKLVIDDLPKIDAFSYGFPCNDFSLVGEQKGFNGIFGPLYTYGIKVLNKFKPKFFVAENVSGLSSANGGDAFQQILTDLTNAGNGYLITPHLYRAEDYGVPQTRHRIIIVGIDKSLGMSFKVPAPTHKYHPVTAREALESPPILNNALNNEKKRQSQKVVERLQHIKPGQNVWNADLPDHLKLNVKSAKLSQIYKRLDPNRPSYTITASGGGGTHGYHYNEPRALTNRERARIQTFPDSYSFEGSIESVRKQIGMAVPPKLSNVIFTSILKTFAKIDYNFVTPNIHCDYQLKIM